MNRIIVIGNGFDLAHGLKTSYKNFIYHFWENNFKYYFENLYQFPPNALFEKAFYNNRIFNESNLKPIQQFIFNNISEDFDLLKHLHSIQGFYEEFLTPLLRVICKNINKKGWSDIEDDYYQLMKGSAYKRNGEKPKIKTLFNECSSLLTPTIINSQLDEISNLLKEYLIENTKNPVRLNEISSIIHEPIYKNDIATNNYDDYDFYCEQIIRNEYPNLISRWKDNGIHPSVYETILKEYSESKQNVNNILDDYLVLPNQILLLNFNYTNTCNQYFDNKQNYISQIHIHGSLDKPNSLIFGYGDEMDKDYEFIQDLNDNQYLEKIKSIKYLEGDNYRKLLNFIESDKFQIYIMGHSCGNSDRTLLNSLFEHQNCVTIKPFYHKLENGSDNYMEIIQNISRNFTDMNLMRDRVVNKTFCEPLPQNNL